MSTLGHMLPAFRLLTLLLIAAALACRGGETGTKPLTIATTTSVMNSGLLTAILPAFESRTSTRVRIHAVGSGQALKMLHDGEVELTISHAPEAETEYLARHPEWSYFKIAYNGFVIVGPKADPAGVRTAGDAIAAFRRIAANESAFVSRGDSSGTHEREAALWKYAGGPTRRLATSGGSMAVTLRQANETNAYTLSDEATFRQLQPRLELEVLFQDDERLLNTYAVIAPREHANAERLSTWLRGDGQALIDQYLIGGQPAFHRWPNGCRDDTPIARPCR